KLRNANETHCERKITVRAGLVLAWGDSISAGEGNPHWLAGFDFEPTSHEKGRQAGPATWWDPRCDRSLFSFSSQAMSVAAVQVSEHNPDAQASFTYLNFACSGAD